VDDDQGFGPCAAALDVLSKRREELPALPLHLFWKRGILVVLVLEVASLYRQLSTSAALTHVASNRVCNCLALIQSVATHQASKAFLIDARIPLLLYPLLTLPGSDRASEFVRVTTLGMIGSLVKEDDSQSVFFLVESELIPLCLRIMGNVNSTDRARSVSAWIVQKLLLNDFGLWYVCQTPERFYAVASTLAKMVDVLLEVPSIRALKHVIRTYLRLCDNPTARAVFKHCFPYGLLGDESLQDLPRPIRMSLSEDPATAQGLQMLLRLLNQ